MLFRQLFDSDTSTYTYLLADEDTREAALIDSVRERVDRDLALLRELGLTLRYALETHVHADHVTGAGELRARTGATTGVAAAAVVPCADLALRDGDELPLGKHRIRVMSTPGHTDGCLSYHVEDLVFTGDALLVRGTGRTDFQQGDARRLHHSITQRLFALPDSTLVYPGHDYNGRTVSTIGEERAYNPRVGAGKTEAEFVELMAKLDLPAPKRIQEAVPANLGCGRPNSQKNEEKPGFLEQARAEKSADGVLEVDPSVVPELTSRHGVRLVDVREPSEFDGELGHIDGAELVPLATVAKAAESWSRRQPIVTVCRSGGRSARAAALLERLGFEHVASLRGGMTAFRTETASARPSKKAG